MPPDVQSQPASAPDTAALRAAWHPVAWSADVADRPVGTTLLAEPVALWRDAGGTVRAVRDLCIHRGTALSLGWIDGGEIVCPYHGWRYEVVRPEAAANDDEVLVAFEETIFSQDRTVVESQRPGQVPFDLAAELHVRFDAVAVAYRRAMREQGYARA
jgi:phenylpropionate dioxygenase-like ring-hydroxylating dioxygenase large terminal subunit